VRPARPWAINRAGGALKNQPIEPVDLAAIPWHIECLNPSTSKRAYRWRGTGVMSDQAKTIVAYIVGVSILLLAWTYFKTWEPSLPVADRSAIATPHRPGSAPSLPVARD